MMYLELLEHSNNKRRMDYSIHILHLVDNSVMIHILVTYQTILGYIVLHLVPTLCGPDDIKSVIII